MNVRPSTPVQVPLKGTDKIAPMQGTESGTKQTEGLGQSTAAHATSLRSLALDAREAFLDMPVSILKSAVLTRAEWGWRNFLASFLAASIQAPKQGAEAANAAGARMQEQPASSTERGSVRGQQPTGSPQRTALPQQPAGSTEQGSVSGQQPTGSTQRTALPQQPTTDSTHGAGLSQQPASSTEQGSVREQQPTGSTQGGRLPQQPTTGSTQGAGLPQQPTTGSTQGAGLPQQLPGSAAQPSGQTQLSSLVSTMRQVVHQLATQPAQGLSEARVPIHVDTPTVVPFSKITVDHPIHGDSPIVHGWTLLDRMSGAVQDAQAPQYGAGVVLLPQPSRDDARAVRWQAHRSSQRASSGQVIHRLMLDVEVHNQPVRVTLITSRPEMAVNVQTNDTHLRELLDRNRPALGTALGAAGWNLSQFTLSTLDYEGDETS